MRRVTKLAAYRRRRFGWIVACWFIVGVMIGLAFLFLTSLPATGGDPDAATIAPIATLAPTATIESVERPVAFVSPVQRDHAPPAPAPVGTEPCTAVAVYDGDGPIHCREGWKVRLDGIAAREMDETCRPNHPCPDASGQDARDTLVRLLGGATGQLGTGHITIRPIVLACRVTGQSYDRRNAWCALPDGTDLSCAMIASGRALRWDKYWRRHDCP